MEAVVGDPARVPVGWWGTMDATLVPLPRPPRISRQPDAPFLLLHFRSRTAEPDASDADDAETPAGGPAPRRRRRPDVRALVRASPARHLFQSLRPFDGHRPGPASRAVLEAVRAAGFRYAFTKACFGPTPRVVTGVDGLTVLNYTAGRWDGWTPFETVNRLSDLRLAERRLLRRGRPGWLVSSLDTCLWAFSGSVWERGGHLREICDWMAAGGASGRLVNVPPRVVARYAALLLEMGLVEPAPAE